MSFNCGCRASLRVKPLSWRGLWPEFQLSFDAVPRLPEPASPSRGAGSVQPARRSAGGSLGPDPAQSHRVTSHHPAQPECC